MSIIKARIPLDLLEELEKRFPQKCISPLQSINDALFYSGKASLVTYLRYSYEEQNKAELW